MISKLCRDIKTRHDDKRCVITSKSSLLLQKVSKRLSFVKKFVNTSKICQKLKSLSWHKKTSWRQKVRHDIKNTSWRQTFRHDFILRHAVKMCIINQKHVMTSKSSSWWLKYVMTSKSSSWHQKHGMTSNGLPWRQTFVMKSKTRHDVTKNRYYIKTRFHYNIFVHEIIKQNMSGLQKAGHGVKHTSWRHKVRLTSKTASWRQKVSHVIKKFHDVKTFVMTSISATSWRLKVCHIQNVSCCQEHDDYKRFVTTSKSVKTFVMTSKSSPWHHKYVMASKRLSWRQKCVESLSWSQ